MISYPFPLAPCFAAAWILTLGFPAGAIQLGDPAPALNISSWVKGEPLELKSGQGKNIYVVEFWATWCGPCRTSIPHLSEIQKKLKDKNVVIIGISDETTAKVEPFVKEMGAKMDYVVALDKERGTYKSYMQAFKQNGIPHAFIVDKQGNLVWHGHPMAGMDKVLEKVIAGTFDLAAAKREAEAELLTQEYFKMVTEANADPEAKQKGRKVVADSGDNAEMLNGFAWVILTHPAIKSRDLELATLAAKKAYDLTDGKDAAIVDTYARALFDTGKKDEAIAMQRKAIELAKDPDTRAGLEDTLDRYIQKSKK